jgi:hypothetical protein
MMETTRVGGSRPGAQLTKTDALPVNVRKFLKWIVDPDLVKRYHTRERIFGSWAGQKAFEHLPAR